MMRRALLALAALCAFVSCALAVPPSEIPVLLGAPGWVLPGASLDMDFANGRYYGLTPSRLTTTRASTESEVCNGTLYTFAANQPAITPCGLWVWEARTNSNTNSIVAGSSPGTPGTAPTGYSVGVNSGTGITTSIVGSGTETGINYVDVNYSGTNSTTDYVRFQAETVAILYGQTISNSLYVKLQSGTLANTSGSSILTVENNAGGGFLTQGNVAVGSPTAGALGANRVIMNYTAVNASVAKAYFYYGLRVNSGAAVNFTLRFGLTGQELNPNIPATVASATVASGGTGSLADGAHNFFVYGNSTTTTPATLGTTTTGGVVTAINSVGGANSYSAASGLPASPAFLSETAFIGSVTGGTLTVSSMLYGTIAPAASFKLYTAADGTSRGTITGSIGGSGGTGTYTTTSGDLASTTFIAASFTTLPTVTLTPTDNSASGFATGPILTSGAAATRASSTITLPASAQGAGYSLFCAMQPQAPAASIANQVCAQYDNGSTTQRLLLSRAAFTGGVFAQMSSGQFAATGVVAQGALGKIAASFSGLTLSQTLNGVAPVTNAAGSAPTSFSRIVLGSNGALGGIANAAIPRIGLWTRAALSAAQLQAVTR